MNESDERIVQDYARRNCLNGLPLGVYLIRKTITVASPLAVDGTLTEWTPEDG
jgi:hypothetical protein